MDDRLKWIGGNWKMNGSRASVQALTLGLMERLADCRSEVVVFPPAVFLAEVQNLLGAGRLPRLGAQNLCSEAAGAFTGEVSATMLTEFDCSYCIVGHSERRRLYRESDELIAAKFAACHRSGIRPVLCVGETLEQHQAGLTREVVLAQLETVLERNGWSGFRDAVIAYEPVWAIGTGLSAAPEEAQDVHSLIRTRMRQADESVAENVRIVYGGSVTPGNAARLFECPDIDGALVGGASLDADSFTTICQAAD